MRYPNKKRKGGDVQDTHLLIPRSVGGLSNERTNLKVWMTITLGLYHNVDALLEALTSQDCCISHDAEWTMRQANFIVSSEISKVDLVLASARQLGLRRDSHYGNIFDCGIGRGLQPCSAEIAPQLRRQYVNQPEGEILRIVARERITDEKGRRKIFAMMQSEGRPYLDTCGGWTEICYRLDDIFVWSLPRKIL